MTYYGYIDTETRSWIDIKSAGTIKYAEECEPLCVTWILPNSDVCHLWEVHKGPIPRDLHEALTSPKITWVAHNAMFDRTVISGPLGYTDLADPTRWVCTAALSRYYGLPGALWSAGLRLGLPEQLLKFDDSGGVETFTKKYTGTCLQPEEDPERWARFMDYAKRDTIACKALHRALSKRIPKPAAKHWRDHEREVFVLDQECNALGVYVDAMQLDSVLDMIQEVQPILVEEMRELTGGEVEALGSPKLIDFLRSEFLINLMDMRKETRLSLLDGTVDLDPRAEEILRLRDYGHKTSLAKYGRMDAMLSSDGRARAAFLYRGAHTGRWAGQGFQPQNLTRPTDDLDPVEVANNIVACHGDHHQLKLIYDQPIFEVLTSGIRGTIKAPKGRTLIIGDYNQIESRITAWYAQCTRKLDAFRGHDDGTSDLDPYEVTALDVLGDASRRQEGKIMDLGLGFGMGFRKFAHVAKVDEDRSRELVYGWRDAYKEVPMLWDAIADLFQATLGRSQWSRFEGTKALAQSLRDRGVRVTRDDYKVGMLTLPNGNPLFYHRLRHATWAECMRQAATFGRLDEAVQRFAKIHKRPYSAKHDAQRRNYGQLAFMGTYGNQRLVHGGFLVENLVQATAREVMAEHMLKIKYALGLVPLLHAHDELVYEVDNRTAPHRASIIEALMETTPAWAEGLPLRAAVHTSPRYTK